MRTKRSRNSCSRRVSDSSSRYSRSAVRMVTYLSSARRYRILSTGTRIDPAALLHAQVAARLRLRAAASTSSDSGVIARTRVSASCSRAQPDRLDQIVDRVQLEGLERVGVVRGGEDDRRRLRQLLRCAARPRCRPSPACGCRAAPRRQACAAAARAARGRWPPRRRPAARGSPRSPPAGRGCGCAPGASSSAMTTRRACLVIGRFSPCQRLSVRYGMTMCTW